jgi:imidazolonepropionase-like amidohydrolase
MVQPCQGLLAILAFSFLAFGQGTSSSVSSKPIAISGGTLVDVASGSQVPDSLIIVRGDRIEQVGRLGQLTGPKDATVIDARGKWILPGLMDMHSHVGNSDVSALTLQLYLANGVTTIRDPGGFVAVLRLEKQDIDSGKTIGPHLFFCGDILDGMPPVHPEGSLLVDSPERAHSAVTFLADQGVDCIKVYNNVKEPELKEIIRAARARNLPVIGHVPRTLTMTQAVELGMQGLEHIRITGRELLPLEEANKIDFLLFAKRETLL